MKKQLTLAILFTTLLSLVLSTFLVAILIGRNQQKLTQGCDMSGIAFGFTWFIIIVMAAGSNSIYFNCYQKIRENKTYSFLSFFLIPLSIAIISVWLMSNLATDGLIYLAIILPYLFIFAFHYYRFRQNINRI